MFSPKNAAVSVSKIKYCTIKAFLGPNSASLIRASTVQLGLIWTHGQRRVQAWAGWTFDAAFLA